MSDCLSLLDQALELGKRELTLLTNEEVDDLEEMAKERRRLISKAMENHEDVSLHELYDKLQQLQSLQGRLTTEAQRLHESVKRELQRTKQETTRHAGYGKALKTPPLFNRFLSKRG
jgi:glutamyl-tRNA reductase